MIEGYWFEEGSAARISAALYIDAGHYTIRPATGESSWGSIEAIDVSDRLGNVERVLKLADNSVFVTNDNDAVDQLFKPFIKTNRFLHALESSLGWVFVALIVTVFTGYAFFKWGVPWTGNAIAHALPQKTNELIGANTLEFLDDYLFEQSELDQVQRDTIREHFISKLLPLEGKSSEINYVLHFRSWEENDVGIPNALALPSGDIILTDKFVELSKSQDEIDSVLLHEMGHVVHRHTLETIVQGTLVTTAIMLTTGDLSSAADLGVGIGSLLLSTNYSREHESEADQYAFEHMLSARINPESFSTIMNRITSYDGDKVSTDAANTEPSVAADDTPSAAEDSHPKDTRESTIDTKLDNILDYISTHPSTADRVKQAQRYAQCYRKGLLVCDVPRVQ